MTKKSIKAIWNGQILAESKDTVVVENNHYFPRESLNLKYFEESRYTTNCSWKGTANYYTIVVEGKTNPNAAWYYPETKKEADHIQGRIAFWHGVRVTD